MLGALAFSHLLMPVALTLQDYNAYACGTSGVCLWIGEGNREKRKKERRIFFSIMGRD
jgi:hypothetical protein